MTESVKKTLTRRILSHKRTLITLIIMYAVFCVFRYLMALSTSRYPIVMIDEILYYSMARSMGAHGRISFMGQPANYNSVLFSVLLSPVYWLPEGTNYYRIIQLIDTLLFNLALFPIYALARRVCGDARKALALSFISMLAPDFILGQLIMSECILYPMFFLSAYLFYVYLQERNIIHMVWFGVLAGAVFCTKPGIVAYWAVTAVFLLAAGLIRKDRRMCLAALTAAAAMAAFTLIFYLFVSLAFNHHPDQYFGLYQSQLSLKDKALNPSFLFTSAWMYPCCFILACAGGIFITPVMRIKDMGSRDRMTLIVMLASVFVLLMGTAWTVNRVEKDLAVHLRYTAEFIPLFLIMTFARDASDEEKRERAERKALRLAKRRPSPPVPAAEDGTEFSSGDAAEFLPQEASQPAAGAETQPEKRRPSLSLFLLIPLYMLIVVAFFNVLGSIRGSGNVVFELSVSWLNSNVWGTGFLAAILAAGVILFTAVLIVGRFSTKFRQWASAAAALCVFVTGEFTYGTLRSYIQPIMKESTEGISSVLDGDPYLYVYSTWVYYNTELDIRSRDETTMCYVNDLYNNMMHQGGRYVPFVPNTQRGAIPANMTPDTDLIVMDTNSFHQIQLSDSASVLANTPLLKAIRITPGERWLDSMMGGIVEGNVLRKGTTLNIVLFNEELSSGKGQLKFDIDVDQETELILTIEGRKPNVFTVPDYRDTYTMDIPKGATWITIVLPNSSAHLYSYETTVAD